MRGWLICRSGSIGTMCRAVTELKRYLPGCSVCMAVFVLLAACATPYQPQQQTMPTGGYQEEQLDDGVYLVHFSGNGHSKLDTVIRYWNRRALELCPKGFTLLEQQQNIAHAALPVDRHLDLDPVFRSQVVPHIVSVDIPYVYGKISCK